MIFKSSFLISMWENLKRRNWVFAIAMITYIMYFPVGTFLQISSYQSRNQEAFGSAVEMEYFGMNELGIFLVMALGVIIGIQGYAYLQNKRKLDFYQSVPVDETKRFFTIYLNGYVLFLVVYVSQLLLSLLITACYQPIYSEILTSAWTGLVSYALVFALTYHIAILAVMLTGNIIITIIATGVLFGYELAIRGLIAVLNQYFLQRYSSYESERLMESSTSPIFLVVKTFLYEYEETLVRASIERLLLAAVILGLAYLAYYLRKVDRCNRAIAFRDLMRPLKYLVTIPCSLCIGMIFYSVTYLDKVALYFGMILSAIILHMLFEAIYHYDIKACIRKPIDLLVILTLGIGILVGYENDILGYDRYVPQVSELDSYALIGEGKLNGWVSLEDLSYVYDDLNQAEENMFITQTEAIVALANAEYNQLTEEPVNALKLEVIYRLKNGETKYRIVYVDREDEAAIGNLDLIYTDSAFKENSDPLYSVEMDDMIYGVGELTVTITDGITSYQYPSFMNQGFLNQQQQELLEQYREDYRTLTYTMRATEIPVAVLELSSVQRRADGSETRTFNFSYPIYDSFEGTIELLEAAGIQFDGEVRVSGTSEIRVYDYQEYSSYNGTLSEEELQSIASELIPRRIYDYYGGYRYTYGDDPYYATLEIAYEAGDYFSYVVPITALPSTLLEQWEGYEVEEVMWSQAFYQGAGVGLVLQ